jgi:hypothetical protein
MVITYIVLNIILSSILINVLFIDQLYNAHEKLKKEQTEMQKSRHKLEAVAMLRESNERLKESYKVNYNIIYVESLIMILLFFLMYFCP